MTRRIIHMQRCFGLALAGAVFFLSFLPSLGWAWHRVLPEHAHWNMDLRHDSFQANAPIAQAKGVECAASGESTLHLPSFSGFQVAVLTVGLAPAHQILIPDGFSSRIVPESLNLSPLFLPRRDPPPKTV